MTTIKNRWLAIEDDGSRPAAEIAEELGCNRNYVYDLRTAHRDGPDEDAVPIITGHVIAAWREEQGWTKKRLSDLLGVHHTTISRWELDGHVPRAATRERLIDLGCPALEEEPEEEPRCEACTAIGEPRVPLMTPELVARFEPLVDGELLAIEERLCLWCWMQHQGIDQTQFYESGAWRYVIDWRPPYSLLNRFCDAVRHQLQRRNATCWGAAREAGIAVQRMQQVVAKEQVCLAPDELVAICDWAGFEVETYEAVLDLTG